MKIVVKRNIFTDVSTIGSLSVDGEFLCYTLEDRDRRLEAGGVKVDSLTCIPRGIYSVLKTWSNHFQKYLPELVNVPKFVGVRIHSGNKAEDTEGCILVGESYGENVIYDSRAAFNKLFDAMELAWNYGDKITIEVI